MIIVNVYTHIFPNQISNKNRVRTRSMQMQMQIITLISLHFQIIQSPDKEQRPNQPTQSTEFNNNKFEMNIFQYSIQETCVFY